MSEVRPPYGAVPETEPDEVSKPQPVDTSSWFMLNPADPELERAWESLCSFTGSKFSHCDQTGECWQYMGSVTELDDDRSPCAFHEFRHRSYTGRGPGSRYYDHQRAYFPIPASEGWTP